MDLGQQVLWGIPSYDIRVARSILFIPGTEGLKEKASSTTCKWQVEGFSRKDKTKQTNSKDNRKGSL